MSTVGQMEKRTQARIVALLQERLSYDFLGNQIDSDNRNIEPKLLTSWLLKQGVSDTVQKTIDNYSIVNFHHGKSPSTPAEQLS